MFLSIPQAVGPSLHSLRSFVAGLLVVGCSAGLNLSAAPEALARQTAETAETALPTVSLARLPAQARETERLIRAGGPFPHDKDGTVFGNRERLLPRQARGFYREYTVRTPGVKHRGARRIVCGGMQPREPEACFYTEDHYASFSRIVP